jgi:hypothetical protein
MSRDSRRPAQRAPLSDSIIVAIARLVDDAKAGHYRAPSHHDLETQIRRAGLRDGDPNAPGQPALGKRKRVEGVLRWALENDAPGGERLVALLVSGIRGLGGFRPDSENFVGMEAIRNASAAFREEGYWLSDDGELAPLALESLSGSDLTAALKAYVRRAQRGLHDAALVTGTGKDLLEAAAAHVLVETFGQYSSASHFPTLLGQAFTAVGLATTADPSKPGERAQKRLERALYEAGCAVNSLRNKEGTGHGRPWLPNVSEAEARVAVEIMGSIVERLLQGLEEARH